MEDGEKILSDLLQNGWNARRGHQNLVDSWSHAFNVFACFFWMFLWKKTSTGIERWVIHFVDWQSKDTVIPMPPTPPPPPKAPVEAPSAVKNDSCLHDFAD